MKLKYDYDKENDILFIFDSSIKEKYEYSQELGNMNFVIDFTNDGKVKGIEILGFSKLAKKLEVSK